MLVTNGDVVPKVRSFEDPSEREIYIRIWSLPLAGHRIVVEGVAAQMLMQTLNESIAATLVDGHLGENGLFSESKLILDAEIDTSIFTAQRHSARAIDALSRKARTR